MLGTTASGASGIANKTKKSSAISDDYSIVVESSPSAASTSSSSSSGIKIKCCDPPQSPDSINISGNSYYNRVNTWPVSPSIFNPLLPLSFSLPPLLPPPPPFLPYASSCSPSISPYYSTSPSSLGEAATTTTTTTTSTRIISGPTSEDDIPLYHRSLPPLPTVTEHLNSDDVHYTKNHNSRALFNKVYWNDDEKVTDSLFSSGGLGTPPSSSQFLPLTRLDWKNCSHPVSTVSLNQANGIFLQSQTDYVSSVASVTKKTETCFGRWAHNRLEPLHIQVPPLYPVTNLSIKTESISCESNRSSKFDDLPTPQPAHQNPPKTPNDTNNSNLFYPQENSQPAHQNSYHRITAVSASSISGATTTTTDKTNVACSSSGLMTTMNTNSPSSISSSCSNNNNLVNGCSRTIPISWSSSYASNSTPSSSTSSSAATLLGLSAATAAAIAASSQQQSYIESPTQTHHHHQQQQHHHHHVTPSSSSVSSSSSSSLTLLQIKREPCQVSEVTTSNNLGHHHQQQHTTNQHHRIAAPPALTAVVKIESSSPKSTVMENHTQQQNTPAGAGAIPVGIAVARQRLQEHTSAASHQHQSKEINRFGIGIADIGGATSALSQNMFFTGTNSTMIPLNSDTLSLGVPNVQNAIRTPPTFWQYPTHVPVESMLPMPVPPVGFQLVRDPSTGQFLFLPAATAAIEPFQSAVVWPTTYSQPTAAATAAAMQQPHLLLPPISQSLQPPPLAPLQLLGSDYLTTASTTLHQHTQTHSTRFVALTADSKRKSLSGPTMSLPVSHHALIKIEDCNTSTNTLPPPVHSHHHQQQPQQHQTMITTGPAPNLYIPPPSTEDSKIHHDSSSISSSLAAATATQTNDIPAHIFYHQPSGGLIQISHQNSQTNTITTECRSVGNETSPYMPQIISSSSPHPQLTSLAPLNESIAPEAEATTDGLVESSKNCVPEVQDATIQTDTPVMSEDDNTCGASDECSLSNQHHQQDEEKDVVIPSSTTISEHLSPPLACHDVSTNLHEEDKETLTENVDTDSSRNDSGFGSNAVTSTNSLEEPSSATEEMHSSSNVTIVTEEDQFTPYNTSNVSVTNNNNVTPSMVRKETSSSTPVDLSGLELLSNISIEAFEKKTVTYIKKEPVEEKTNNSSFEQVESQEEEKVPEENENISPKNTPATTVTTSLAVSVNGDGSNMSTESFVQDDNEQLGGLNLLCALAEQRIQEEDVCRRRRRKRSSSTDSRGSKKKKHKHSKSNKKSKHHDKEKKEKKRRHRDSREFVITAGGAGDEMEVDTIQNLSSASTSPLALGVTANKEVLQEGLKETLNRMKASYTKMGTCKNESIPHHCCREKCGWPTPEELLSAMEKDMRLRLADITRQCQEKKKELEEIAPILQHRKSQLFSSDRESTPLSSKGSVKSFPEKQECKWFVQSLQSEEIRKTPSDSESCKLDDVETSSTTSSSRRKGSVPKKQDDNNTETIVAKKSKTLVGCILASKNRFNDPSLLTTDDASLLSEVSCKMSLNQDSGSIMESNSMKQETFENSMSRKHQHTFAGSGLFESNLNSLHDEKKYHRKSSKHHSKHKKSKSGKDKKHRELKERKKRIDARCLITIDILDQLENNKLRVLTAMGGLFYAGSLTALQPPDIYSVTLDGERGNRPHIMTREDVLRDAILEVSPNSVEEIPPGTRVCAYWSQQYRCLYPGITAEREAPDVIHDRLFVGVEFDDGDNGKIPLEDIRFLLSDCPIMEYDPNPLLTLGRRKRRTSANMSECSSVTKSSSSDLQTSIGGLQPATTTIVHHLVSDERLKLEANKRELRERKRLKKLLRKDKLKKLEVENHNHDIGTAVINGSNNQSTTMEKKHRHKHKCGEEFCKHRKHKKRRKHKRHHRNKESAQESSQNTSPINFNRDANTAPSENIATVQLLHHHKQQEEEQQQQQQHKDVVKFNDQSQDGKTEIDEDIEMKEEVTGSDVTSSQFNHVVAGTKEETTTEEDDTSNSTETSDSLYQPGKKKERHNSGDNHSKIAAFLPARQLWGWAGTAYRRSGAKGRARKNFYRSIQRGKEIITVGDSAVFLSTGRPDRPYIGQIESMWETSSGNKVVRVRWFYHPEETVGCPNLKYPGALFQSPHEDENDVQTISHKCEVLPLIEYTNKFGEDPKQYQSIYDNNDTYYLAGYYDPTVQNLKLQEEIPKLQENDKWE